MHSVTSNAVASMLVSDSTSIEVSKHNNVMNLYRFGKVVFMSFEGGWTSLSAGDNGVLGNIPQGYRPASILRLWETSDFPVQLIIYVSGEVACYNYGSTFTSLRNGRYTACWLQ